MEYKITERSVLDQTAFLFEAIKKEHHQINNFVNNIVNEYVEQVNALELTIEEQNALIAALYSFIKQTYGLGEEVPENYINHMIGWEG